MTKKYYSYEETHRSIKGRKQKYCTKCKKWKARSKSEFRQDSSKKDGLRIWCKECDITHERERYRKNRRKRKNVRQYLRYEQRHRAVNRVKEKLCTKCRRWKKESDFYKDRSTKDGLAARCRKCSYKVAHKSRKKRPKPT